MVYNILCQIKVGGANLSDKQQMVYRRSMAMANENVEF